MPSLPRWFALIALAALCSLSAWGGVELRQSEDKVTVQIDGHLFTEYHFSGARRPYLYPVIGATGAAMTRHWPLEDDVAAEERDHPHHKGLWYGHHSVNGASFWADSGKPGAPLGQIVHDGFVEIKSGDEQGSLRAKNKWVVDGTDEVVCTDERAITFHKGQDGPMIDFDITLQAGEKGTVFGDDKDGAMAIRVAESMRAEGPKAKGEKVGPKGEGHIETSEGKTDLAAWGSRANWCDYWGPVEGRTVGIAMFDHPQNPQHPTWWHARTYGLFAANPFGQAQFEKLPQKTEFKIPAGQSVTFRYRFYFHEGDTRQAKVAEHYEAYALPAK